MSLKIVVDTNIFIDHLRNIPNASRLLKEIEDGNFEGLISAITVMELMAAPKMTEQRFEVTRELIDMFELVPVDGLVATTSGKFLAKYRASHGLEPMDAIIAATASTNDAALFTLNTKHFKYIDGLIVINPYLTYE